MIKKIILGFIGILISLVGFQYFYGGKSEDVVPMGNFEIFAHRGVHAHFNKAAYSPSNGCEAINIFKPDHEYIENTIESLQAAFDMGATIIEIDIRRTSDNYLVVFHDNFLECRTNGVGKIDNYPLEYLKSLDIGYNYTYDNGKTFPFRGKGLGKMPTLNEILQAFPNNKFLLDHKDRSEETATLLIDVLKDLSYEQQKNIYYFGNDAMFNYIHKEIPGISWLICNRYWGRRWFKKYWFTLGAFGFPKEANGYVIALPLNYTKYIWKWPYRFINDLHKSGARFYLMIDSEDDAQKYAHFPADGIITDYIEVVGKYYKNE